MLRRPDLKRSRLSACAAHAKIGTGEPHGTIRFTGGFDTLTWRSMSYEYWNGFTVGVQGSAAEVPVDVPVPAPWLLLLAGGAGLLTAKRYRKTAA